MALPSSGPISLNDVNIELGRSSGATISMNESAVRGLFQVASGSIGMSSGRGKANQFSFSFSGGTNVDLRSAALSNGWNGSSKVVATNTGTVQSSSTGTPALTISGSFPGGVDFINNGLVVGRGGNGGSGGVAPNGAGSGGSAGTALSVSTAVSITNNSTIAGGGGGGGGGGSRIVKGYYTLVGGGGGGGIGVSSGGSPNGGSGSTTSAGSGGGGGSVNGGYSGAGGTGGTYGSSGASGGSAGSSGSAGASYPAGGGGGAGPCTSGNSNITWIVTGNRYGALN